MQFIIITSCTRRKKSNLPAPLTADRLTPGTHNTVANEWLKNAKKSQVKISTEELYVGRAILEAKKAVDILKAQLIFASTGFGLIDSKTTVPNYDLTVVDTQDSIRRIIVDEPFSSQKWWSCINRIRGTKKLSTQLEESPKLIIFLALPKAYLELIKQEFDGISKESSGRLRIFTSPDNANALPESIKSSYIPYDERFDGIGSPVPGTRSDYPQRIMRHFIESIFDPNKPSLTLEKERVLHVLRGMNFREKIERLRLNDGEIRNTIIQNWENGKLSSARMLRILRDDLAISCEQKRFSKIYRELKNIESVIYVEGLTK